MNHMPEAASELNIVPAEAPALFRLGPAGDLGAKDALHQIQKNGMEDPQSAHQLLSLFQPEEFTSDPFHVLSSDQKPQTMWDQLTDSASNEGNLSGDQKIAIISIKRFALESLAENSSLDEPVRDAAKTELREYDATVAKLLDPDDPASARFFDRAKAAGKIAGKAAQASGTAYLVLNLMGCYGDYYFPTPIELPTVTANPDFTQTVPAIETPSPDQFQPTLTPSGPETTPNVPRPYPTSLTVETAQQGIVAVVDAPAEITGLPEVQAIVAKHTQLARDKGLVFDHMAVKYAPADQRWFLVPVAGDGTTIAGWLQIADSSSQSGWRYGEQPTWDSRYSPSTDTYQYGLPPFHDSANHFEVGFENGFPVLIEVTSSGTPQYWNNIVEKSTMLIEGAVIPTETPTPISTSTEVPTPKPAWQTAMETQDPQDQFFKVVDGAPTIDRYDTAAVESIVLVQESIKSIATTDGLNPNILTGQDADGNTYAFNPDHGWFALPEVQMEYAKLAQYTAAEEDYFYDGRNNIVRALNYFYSSEKISPDAHLVMWVTATDTNDTSNLVCLSFFPVGETGVAQRLWPTEYYNPSIFYTQENKPFVFSGFYKVKLNAGGSIYVIDRTIKIDDTHTTGLANGFDQATYEKMNIYIGDYPGLYLYFEKAKDGSMDFVTLLPPPDRLADGTSIPFDPDTAALDKNFNPVVAGLQGPRGNLILLFSGADQQRILLVLSENIKPDVPGDGIINTTTAPLTDPTALVKLANRILLTTVGTP